MNSRNTILLFLVLSQAALPTITANRIMINALRSTIRFTLRPILWYSTVNCIYSPHNLLVGTDANPDLTLENTTTPLHVAAANGYCQAIKALIATGADPGAADSNGHTPLHLAAWNGHCQAIKTLVEAGADPETSDSNLHTPLHYAAMNGQFQAIKTLVETGANPETSDRNLYTPLYYAAANGHFQAAKSLMQAGAQPIPALASESQMTPLEKLCLKINPNDLRIADLIKRYYLRAIADNGDTILHRLFYKPPFFHLSDQPHGLFSREHDLLLKKIFWLNTNSSKSKQLNINHKNMDGYTILHIAAKNNSLSDIDLTILSIQGADFKATTPSGDTFHSLAAPKIRSLLDSIVTIPKNNWTDLMRFVYPIDDLTPDLEQELIENINHSSDPSYVTDDFESALTVAHSEDVKNIIRLGILSRRRKEIFDSILAHYPQTADGPTDLILQFAGTYEPA